MIRTFLLLLSIFFIKLIYSANVDSIRAKEIAKKFFDIQNYKFNKIIIDSKISKVNEYQYNNVCSFYIFKMSPKGFVIVSSDDNAFPILGYSFENDIDIYNLPISLKAYIDEASKQILIAKSKKESYFNIVWQEIEQSSIEKTVFSNNTIGPLLNLFWDQGVPYNNYCPPHPSGPGGHCVTGCVATAMAMTMKYYNYPERGRGMKTFMWSDIDTIDYENTYYRWTQMTPYANSQSADAIAELMYHCGVAVDMNYGPNGSASYTEWVPDAMRNYFRYHPSIRYKSRSKFFDWEWDMLIRDELNYRRIIIYSGSGTGGHAFICDGYQDTCFYHFNWGWSGYGNGYYYYNDLTPGNNDFSYGQGAVVRIMPYWGDYCKQNVLLTDTARYLEDGSQLSYYWNNTNCSWLIKPTNASSINIHFTKFDTELNNDFLTIYDGVNDQAPILGRFSGNQLPPDIVSTSGSVYVTFITNDTIQGQGWEFYYSSNIVNVVENYLNNIAIYPNPCVDEILIINDENYVLDIEITDILGHLICKKIIDKTNNINVSSLADGIYFLYIKKGHNRIVRKIVKTNKL